MNDFGWTWIPRLSVALKETLSVVSCLGPWSWTILIRLVTRLMHVSASKCNFCLLTLTFQGPMKLIWTSNQGRTGTVRGAKAPVGWEPVRTWGKIWQLETTCQQTFVEQDGKSGFKWWLWDDPCQWRMMDSCFVIPLNESFEHCVWNQDFPRWFFVECVKASKDPKRAVFLWTKYCIGSSVVSFFGLNLNVLGKASDRCQSSIHKVVRGCHGVLSIKIHEN